MSAALGVALAAAVILRSASPAAAASFDVLYIKANVGESAGGHSAIRFADEVYHFQNDHDGTLRLRRTPDPHFRWTYAVLQNRTIHVARIGVSAETADRLRDAFNRRFLLHNAHARILDAHRRDRDLLDALITGGAAGPHQFPIRGAGLFAPASDDAAPPSPALVALRARVLERYGPTFLHDRLVTLRTQLRRLEPAATPDQPPIDKARHPTPALRFSERYDALAEQIVALEILDDPRPLAPTALLAPDTAPRRPLAPAVQRQLTRFAERTATRLVTLAGSDGPDWGFALLLGMARLAALEASRTTGQLLVLDAFPRDAHTIDAASVRRRRHFIQELAREADVTVAEAETRLRTATPVTERDFAQLEEAMNRSLEFTRGARLGGAVRTSSAPLLPDTPASVPGLPPLDRSPTDLRRDRARATAAHEAYQQALEATFGYHLLTANCATEILALIESTFGHADATRRLGGDVRSETGLHFVPQIAHRAVLANWNVTAVGETPSYRRARVDAMYADEFPVAVYLRESNRLTSTTYRRNDADAFFLFFTDDTVPPRPLYGLANITAGAAQAIRGAVRAPLDGGADLRAGLNGILFSLPELFWINIRKGTFEYGHDHVDHVAPRMRVLDAP